MGERPVKVEEMASMSLLSADLLPSFSTVCPADINPDRRPDEDSTDSVLSDLSMAGMLSVEQSCTL